MPRYPLLIGKSADAEISWQSVRTPLGQTDAVVAPRADCTAALSSTD